MAFFVSGGVQNDQRRLRRGRWFTPGRPRHSTAVFGRQLRSTETGLNSITRPSAARQGVVGATQVWDRPMKIATGRVMEGKVVLEGEPLGEGTVVTVVVGEDEETFEASDQDEEALLAAIAQADRGQVISWEELRAQLRRQA